MSEVEACLTAQARYGVDTVVVGFNVLDGCSANCLKCAKNSLHNGLVQLEEVGSRSNHKVATVHSRTRRILLESIVLSSSDLFETLSLPRDLVWLWRLAGLFHE